MFGEINLPGDAPIVSLIAGLIDESGSMTGVKLETIGGYNSFIESIRKEQEGKIAFVSTFLFDSDANRPIMRILRDSVPIVSVKPITDSEYNPSGMTPLYDAIGKAIESIDAAVKANSVTKVTFLIQTDGQENCSREFTKDVIKKLIEARIKLGWQIVFLGADLSQAPEIGRGLGVMAANSMSYSKGATGQTFNMMSASTRSYRGSVTASAAITLSDAEKAELAKAKS